MIESWINSLQGVLQTQMDGSVILAYPIVFLAGILTSLTPCVYPVIPIIVGYIGGQTEKSRLKNFFISLAYVLGMAVVYSVLGAVAAFSGRMFGEVQSNPWVQIVIGNIIIFAALAMLGAVKLPIPSFMKATQEGSQKATLASALFMGVASGFITAPCTTPVLMVLLTYAGEKQNVFLGMTLLLTYSLGMGVLLVLLGTFVGLLKTLPKPGKWMLWIEKGFGFVMILLGEYFLIKGGTLLAPGLLW